MLQLPRLSWKVNDSNTITPLYSASYNELSIEDTSTDFIFVRKTKTKTKTKTLARGIQEPERPGKFPSPPDHSPERTKVSHAALLPPGGCFER